MRGDMNTQRGTPRRVGEKRTFRPHEHTLLFPGENTKASLYLGCNHRLEEHTTAEGVKVRAMVYDMTSFNRACIDKYCELAKASGVDATLRRVATPFLNADGGGESLKDDSCTQCAQCKFAF